MLSKFTSFSQLNFIRHGLWIYHQLKARNPDYGESFFSKSTVPKLVASQTVGSKMVFTIDLSDEFDFKTAKVSGVGWNRMFASKLFTGTSFVSE